LISVAFAVSCQYFFPSGCSGVGVHAFSLGGGDDMLPSRRDAMFSSNKPADKLAAALAEYQRDFETRLEAKPNQDALEAQERINRANKLVKQSGLGDALLTVMEHTKDWPSWSQSADFKKWVGFPVEQVLAKEERKEGKHKSTNIVAVRVAQQCPTEITFIAAPSNSSLMAR
jgi:hypothetical protein